MEGKSDRIQTLFAKQLAPQKGVDFEYPAFLHSMKNDNPDKKKNQSLLKECLKLLCWSTGVSVIVIAIILWLCFV